MDGLDISTTHLTKRPDTCDFISNHILYEAHMQSLPPTYFLDTFYIFMCPQIVKSDFLQNYIQFFLSCWQVLQCCGLKTLESSASVSLWLLFYCISFNDLLFHTALAFSFYSVYLIVFLFALLLSLLCLYYIKGLGYEKGTKDLFFF